MKEFLTALKNKALEILTSIRFWQIVLGAIFGYLSAEGIMSSELANMLMTILFGSAAVGTLDKFSKRK